MRGILPNCQTSASVVSFFLYGSCAVFSALYFADMEGTCARCHKDLSQGGIVFTPPGDNQTSQNLCMSCFEGMANTEVKPEQAV